MSSDCRRTVAVLIALGLCGASAAAQELTPRLYAPSPTGGNIVVLSYGRSTGELLFDPSLPFTTRIGADFDTFGVAIQTVWFGKR